jgi:two-component system sensor histidine kinase MtrB
VLSVLRGVRARLTVTIVALVALTAAILGIGSYLFVNASLHDQVLREADQQARFDLSVLAPPRLSKPPSLTEIENLSAALQSRGIQTVVDTGTGNPYVSTSGLTGLVGRLPPAMRTSIDQGRIGFAWTSVGGTSSLVVGGRVTGNGPAIYFVRSVESIETTLDQLRLALGVGALVLVLVAVVAARIVARGVLAPVEAASEAAERITQGDFSARVAVTSNDEFGTWADRFNRMAAALDETIGRLEESQAQNRAFVADVSHELRTPVAALVAEASILRDHLDDLSPASRRAGELVVQDIRRLRDLVEELMELSRFDSAAEEVVLQPVDLGRLIRTVAKARHPDAALDLPDQQVVVQSDPRRLERILGNLLDNAREHAPGALVTVSLRQERDDVQITVADRGPGVAADQLARIFDRFFMADPSRRGGSGLGLAIAAEHAALLGGGMRAFNRPDGGLAIELRLPVDATPGVGF